MISTNSLSPTDSHGCRSHWGPRLAVNSQLSPEISWVRSKTKFGKTRKIPYRLFSRWWQLKYFLFSSLLGEDEPNLTHIFSDGLVKNHQPDLFVAVNLIRCMFPSPQKSSSLAFSSGWTPSAFSGFLPPWIWHSRWSFLAWQNSLGGRFWIACGGCFLHFEFYVVISTICWEFSSF